MEHFDGDIANHRSSDALFQEYYSIEPLTIAFQTRIKFDNGGTVTGSSQLLKFSSTVKLVRYLTTTL